LTNSCAYYKKPETSTVLPVGLVLEDRECGGLPEKGGMPVQAAGADKPG